VTCSVVCKGNSVEVDKVSFILPSLGVGGAEKVCMELAERFVDKGKSVEVLLLTPLIDLSIAPGIEVKVLGGRATRWQKLAVLKAFVQLVQIFNRSKGSEAFIASVRGAVVLSLLASLITGWSSRLYIREAALYAPKLWYPRWVHRLFLQFMYPKTQGVISVSQGVHQELSHDFGYRGKVFIINNPLPISKIVELSQLSKKQSKYQFTFLAVGRLVREKGFSVLLSAFAKIARDQNCGLYILGSGPLEQELKKQAANLNIVDNVTFLGFQRNPYPWYRVADVFVLSSLEEGFVNVLAEALAIGVPRIVATRCGGGPEELLADHKRAWMVPPGDCEQLADALADARNSDSHEEYGGQLACELLDSSHIAEIYLNVISRDFEQGAK